MKKSLSVPLVSLALVFAATAYAQDDAPRLSAEQKAVMAAYERAGTPGPQHNQLASAAGTYDMVIRSWDKPGTPPRTESGSAVRRMALDGRVMIEEVNATMMGRPFNGMAMTGYDNVTGKHWSTWNDNMSTGLMVSTGHCDDQGTCNFTGSWNDPVTKNTVNSRMNSRWTDENTEVFEMYGPGPDGKDMKMMEITYTRNES